jgi:hypothetical protein
MMILARLRRVLLDALLLILVATMGFFPIYSGAKGITWTERDVRWHVIVAILAGELFMALAWYRSSQAAHRNTRTTKATQQRKLTVSQEGLVRT